MRKISVMSLGFLMSIGLQAQTLLPVKRVSIYKNGTAMVTKEGTLPVVNDTVKLTVPNAILGTYWLSTAKENLIKDITYKNRKVSSSANEGDVRELLKSNIGKAATLSISTEKEKVATYSGTIQAVFDLANMVKLQEGTKSRLISLHNIVDVAIDNMNDKFTRDSSVRLALIKTNKSVSELQLSETSLQPSIAWIPSYYLSLKDNNSARLEMKSLVENYSPENFENTNVELIVGMPQLSAGNMMDPAATNGMSGQVGGVTYAPQQAMYKNSASFEDRMMVERSVADNYATTFNTSTETGDDLFIYKLGAISLYKNTKASFPVFAQNISFKDLHECEIQDFTNFEYSKFIQPNDNPHDVFHSIEFTNTTEYPFTSGAIFVTDKDGRFTAQDNLKYVPKNGKGIVRLAKDINVSVKNSEEEIERNENVKKINKTYLNKVKIRGTVTVNNYDEKNMTITIKKRVNGSVVTSGDGKVTKGGQHYGNNPNSLITWEVTVPEGGKKEIVYEYETLFYP